MEENTYQWELLNSTVLMVPEEIVAYHIYKYLYYHREKQEHKAEGEIKILSSIIKHEQKESEEVRCLMK